MSQNGQTSCKKRVVFAARFLKCFWQYQKEKEKKLQLLGILLTFL